MRPGGDPAIHGVRSLHYSIAPMVFCSTATTSAGSFAYERGSAMDCPSVNIHCKNSVIAFFLAGSWILDGINNHVKLEIGYASGPAAFVIDTRKSAGMSLDAAAAAAVTLARSAFTKLPDAFRILANGILLWIA